MKSQVDNLSTPLTDVTLARPPATFNCEYLNPATEDIIKPFILWAVWENQLQCLRFPHVKLKVIKCLVYYDTRYSCGYGRRRAGNSNAKIMATVGRVRIIIIK